jgi:hypothetical protein
LLRRRIAFREVPAGLALEHSTACPRFVGTRATLTRTLPEATMHGIIYLIGLIVVIMAILSFFGLR